MKSYESVTARGAQALEAILRDPAHTLLAVDFDGTLAPIIDDPDHAYAPAETIAALGRLGARLGKVAVVTGRPATTAVRLGRFEGAHGLETMTVLGQYGVERWDATTGAYIDPPPPAGIAEVETRLPTLLAGLGLADVRIEHKRRALGLHTRLLADPDGAFARLVDPVRTLAAAHDLAVEPGKQVIEIRGRGIDKGTALRSLMAEAGTTQVIFAGDDLGDLPAYDAIDEMRGEGVPGLLVCSASDEQDALAVRADLVLDGPGAIAGWLDWLASRLGS